ncbi:MAG: hypothetical protein HKN80_06860, partial [Acidimicrobiia bacterium]|nr:hypothetical protein [Acidimicrobiia bacterium]
MSRKSSLVISGVFLALLLTIFAVAQAQDTSANAYGGPGLLNTPLMADQTIDAGNVSIWNSPKKLMVQIKTSGDWLVTETQIYVGYPDSDPIPTRKGKTDLGKFPYTHEYANPVSTHHLTLDLKEDLGFSWGSQSEDLRVPTFAVHADLILLDSDGNTLAEEGAWAAGPVELESSKWGWTFTYELGHPQRGHFIDANVIGLGYNGPTQQGVTADSSDPDGGGFTFFPEEEIEFSVGTVVLGTAQAAKKVSPLDLFPGSDTTDPRVINVARLLQSLDDDHSDGKINIQPVVVDCLNDAALSVGGVDFEIDVGELQEVDALNGRVEDLIVLTIDLCEGNPEEIVLEAVSADEAQGNLEAGLNASGIFRKNMTKTEDLGETKQKLEVMPVYFPGMRSNGDPSLCVDVDGDKIYDELDGDTLGVPYEEWRLNGDRLAAECDPRDFEDPEACKVTLIECRDIAKPILTTYMGKVDIYDDQVNEAFWPDRFSWDLHTAISRDDGTTWKRMNISRMADMSSFDLETGEPFPGTVGSPYVKVNDNKILVAWESKFCKSGNPRYAINLCDDPATTEIEEDDPATPDVNECAVYCTGNPEQGTEVCEPDYPGDDDYFVTDIWGVRGQQGSVDYNEVDDVAELEIGEIPYSCLWTARGVIATQNELDEGTFDSMTVLDDPETLDIDESDEVQLGDIVWFKPERLTSGRRDAYLPMVASARGAG